MIKTIKYLKNNTFIILLGLGITIWLMSKFIEPKIESILSPKISDCQTPNDNKPEKLTGHLYLVNQVAISEDSNFMASASYDEVRVWNLNGKQGIDTQKYIVLGKDNSKLVSEKSTEFQNEDVLLGLIKTVDISSHNNNLLVAGWGEGNQQISVWQISSDLLTNDKSMINPHLKNLFKPPDKTSASDNNYDVKSIAISRDHKYIATGSHQQIKIWEIGEDEKLKFITELSANILEDITDLSFTKNGKILISGDSFGKIQIWDLEEGKLLREISDKNLTKPLTSLSVSDNENVVSGFENGAVIQWQNLPFPSPKRRFKFSQNQNKITSVNISPDGNILGIARFDGIVEFWDLDNYKRLDICQLPRVISNQKIVLSFTGDRKIKAKAIGYGFQTIKFWQMQIN